MSSLCGTYSHHPEGRYLYCPLVSRGLCGVFLWFARFLHLPDWIKEILFFVFLGFNSFLFEIKEQRKSFWVRKTLEIKKKNTPCSHGVFLFEFLLDFFLEINDQNLCRAILNGLNSYDWV